MVFVWLFSTTRSQRRRARENQQEGTVAGSAQGQERQEGPWLCNAGRRKFAGRGSGHEVSVWLLHPPQNTFHS